MLALEEERKLNPDETKVIAAECYEDPVKFCQFFLTHLFPGRIPWVHRGLLAILTGKVDFLWAYGEIDKIERNFVWIDSAEQEHKIFKVDYDKEQITLYLGRYTLIMMPRGSAKTTIAGIMIPLYEILYQEVPFTIYVSEAAPHAKMQLHNVQRELNDNRRLQAAFGSLKPKLRDDERWSGDFFETNTGFAMGARGRGGQVRGLLHRGNRPTKIIVDDVEDKESVNTEMQREKTREWAYGDLIPALPEVNSEGTIIALGTLLHRDALLNTWKTDPEWTVVQFGLKDCDGDYLWPEYMNEEKDIARKRSFAAAGQLHTYYMEYHNEYIAPEIQPFKEDYFIYNSSWDDIVASVIYMDPAISPKRTADSTCIIVVGITDRGQIRVRACSLTKGKSERWKVDTYFTLHKRYKCVYAGIESNAYQAALVHLVREEMFRKGHYFEITAVSHKSRKIERIMEILQPRFIAKYIEFYQRFPELEVELLDLRSDTNDQRDDGPDALAAAITLLDPFAAVASGENDLSKDTMPPLEEVFEDEDWQWA